MTLRQLRRGRVGVWPPAWAASYGPGSTFPVRGEGVLVAARVRPEGGVLIEMVIPALGRLIGSPSFVAPDNPSLMRDGMFARLDAEDLQALRAALESLDQVRASKRGMSLPVAAELTEFLKRERLCLECLARQAGRRPDAVARALEALGSTVRLSQQPALCASCGSVRISYKIQ